MKTVGMGAKPKDGKPKSDTAIKKENEKLTLKIMGLEKENEKLTLKISRLEKQMEKEKPKE